MGKLSIIPNGRNRAALGVQEMNPVPAAITFRTWVEAWRIIGKNDGDSVSSWLDASGNKQNAATSGSATVVDPTYKVNIVNGRAVLRFNGTTQGLDFVTTVDDSMTAAELFIVAKDDNDPPGAAQQAGAPLQMGGAAVSKLTHWPFTDGNIYDAFGTSARKTIGNPTPALTSFRCYNVRTASGLYEVDLSGATNPIFTTATNTVGFGQFGPYIGHANGNVDDRWFDGDLALIVVCPQVLTSGERAIVRAYIAAVYGITF